MPTVREKIGMTLIKLFGVFASAFAAAAACTSAAQAQTYYDRSGTAVQAYVPLPYSFVPLPPAQHDLAPTTSTALTIPAGARYATVCASNATIRYSTDGITIPTALHGQPLMSGSCLALSGPLLLANFRAASSTGTLDVEYFQ